MKKLVFMLCAALLCAAACARDEGAQGEAMNISITINGTHVLSATLADNKSARAFADLLRKGEVTVSMHGYGGFEQVGALPQSLPRSDTHITTESGDIILYQGNQITIYYDTNSWNFTRLGKITGRTQAELRAMLGAGDVTAVFALAE